MVTARKRSKRFVTPWYTTYRSGMWVTVSTVACSNRNDCPLASQKDSLQPPQFRPRVMAFMQHPFRARR